MTRDQAIRALRNATDQVDAALTLNDPYELLCACADVEIAVSLLRDHAQTTLTTRSVA